MQPNLVYLFADQMRAQATGYAGDPNVRTPHLDQLAGQSLNFINAVATCPVCTPARACLLRGQYPTEHGLFLNDLMLGDNGHSFGQTLNAAGYATGWIGKWHLDGHGRSAAIPPERRQGFDYWKVLECTHDYPHSLYYDHNDPTPRVWPGYDAYAQADDAARFIADRCDADRPFALFVSFGTPHDPYETAPEDLKALYPPDELRLRDNVPAHRFELAAEELQGYYAHIAALDRCVERIDAALRDAGLTQDTIFVFTSDHGDMLESHAVNPRLDRGPRKQAPYDESVCVPFLLRYPRRFGASGQRVTLPLGTVDVMPTLLSLCGLTPPALVQGRDVTASLDAKGDSLHRRGALIANYAPFADWCTARGGRPYRGLRTKQHTFVRDRNGPWLLFDNDADPYQLDNLVHRRAYRSLQEELNRELQAELARIGDAFESPESLRRRWGYEVNDLEEIDF